MARPGFRQRQGKRPMLPLLLLLLLLLPLLLLPLLLLPLLLLPRPRLTVCVVWVLGGPVPRQAPQHLDLALALWVDAVGVRLELGLCPTFNLPFPTRPLPCIHPSPSACAPAQLCTSKPHRWSYHNPGSRM